MLIPQTIISFFSRMTCFNAIPFYPYDLLFQLETPPLVSSHHHHLLLSMDLIGHLDGSIIRFISSSSSKLFHSPLLFRNTRQQRADVSSCSVLHADIITFRSYRNTHSFPSLLFQFYSDNGLSWFIVVIFVLLLLYHFDPFRPIIDITNTSLCVVITTSSTLSLCSSSTGEDKFLPMMLWYTVDKSSTGRMSCYYYYPILTVNFNNYSCCLSSWWNII